MDENRALIIVDVQPTFCEGGALAVEGGNAVAEKIADFVSDNLDEYSFIATTQDWHVDPGSHFSDNPDFVDTWPPHGVAGTAEAELHEAITSLPIDVEVKKGEYEAAYSGFEGVDGDGEGMEDILRAANVEEIDVVGIAESHCVKETALDALKAGWPVRVLSDLTVPVSEELGEAARREMDEAGIEQVTSAEAFGFYDEGEDTEIPGDDEAEPVDQFAEALAQDDTEPSLEDDYDDGDFTLDQDGPSNADEDEFDLAGRIQAGLFGAGASTEALGDYASADEDAGAIAQDNAEEDYDLSDFDDVDLDDESIDFSEDASEDDFDFSDIDQEPRLK
ncbi:MAG: isochorismatase family protein [Ancrocorticia populi]|uniref:isochorismatase family protein n=1 Tax=Ancrocorticia populi TaxID=2175228 RepID=UPI003F8F3CA3